MGIRQEGLQCTLTPGGGVIFLLRWNSHVLVHELYMEDIFRFFTDLCISITTVHFRIFSSPLKRNSHSSQHPYGLQPRALTNLLCLGTCLFWTSHINGISHQRTCEFASGFLHLAQCLQVSSTHSTYQYWISLRIRIIFHCNGIPHFIYPFNQFMASWVSTLGL